MVTKLKFIFSSASLPPVIGSGFHKVRSKLRMKLGPSRFGLNFWDVWDVAPRKNTRIGSGISVVKLGFLSN